MKTLKLKSKTLILAVYSIGIILLVITFFVGTKYGIPFKNLTADPAFVFNANPFTGVISNIGILFWCASACCCWFGGFLMMHQDRNREAWFLLASGVFTFVLLIDDLFMFHDHIFYSFEGFKIIQPITFAFYGLLILVFFYKFFSIILKQNYRLLIVSLLLLGSSVFTDLLFVNEGFQYFIEDGLKFLGILSWTLFFTTTSYKLVISGREFTS